MSERFVATIALICVAIVVLTGLAGQIIGGARAHSTYEFTLIVGGPVFLFAGLVVGYMGGRRSR